MAHVEKSIFINTPMEEVFDFVAEPNNLPKYDFMAIEVKERSEGPVGIGTTFIEVVKMPLTKQQAVDKFLPFHHFLKYI